MGFEQRADRGLGRFEPEVAQEERWSRRLLLHAEDLLRGLGEPSALRRGGRFCAVDGGRCSGRGAAVEVVAW